MKRLVAISVILYIAVFSFGCFQAAGQRLQLPAEMVGVDPTELQDKYEKAIDRGDYSMMPPYAELLFYSGKTEQSLKMFRRADSLEVPMNKEQERTFSHAARRLGEVSPYDQQTGYFTVYDMPKVRTEPFCNNSANEDFAPLVWHDLLFVTSSRPVTPRRGIERYPFTQQPYLNVYAFDKDCEPVDTDFLPSPLNTQLHDGPIAVSLDTSLVVITRNYEKPNEQGLKNLYLDFFVKEEGQWSRGKKFPYNHVDHSIQHPYFDDNTNTLYFSSDMPGGYGGFDLYKSSWENGSWSSPENLGDQINSPYDEVFPSVSHDGNLIYASNHIETNGGMDIVLFEENTRYLLPEPFNTPYDDFSITFLDEHSGYFASNRDKSLFDDNIYFFEVVPASFVIRARDKKTHEMIANVSVGFRAEEPALEGTVMTSGTGEAQIHEGYEEAFSVELELTREGYHTLALTTDDFAFEDNRWLLTLEMEHVPDEPAIEEAIRDGFFVVYFDNDHPDPVSWSNTTNLTYEETFEAYMQRLPEYIENSANSNQEVRDFFEDVEKGMEQLEWLAGYMKEEMAQGQHYWIEFTSHTSPLARSDYNLILSQRRFDSVENYMKSWADGALEPFIREGDLNYRNTPMGAKLASPGVSADPRDPARSIYGVDAAKERKVTISWEIREDRPEDVGETPPPLRYHIIVGSYNRLQDAEQQAETLSRRYTTSATVLPRTPEGFYRVSYGSYPSLEDASAALESIRRNVRSDAWILQPER